MIELITEALEHHQAGRRAEAEALYRQVLAQAPHEPTALYLYGLFNFEGGRVEAAAEMFKGVIAARPDHAEGHVALANLRHWQDAHGAAVDGYRRALALAPDHPGALLGLTNALREQGDIEEAVAAAAEAVTRLPDSAAARLAQGAALMGAEQAAAAAEAYREAVRLDGASLDGRTGLVAALLHLGRAREALAAADEALSLAPRSGEVWFLLGTALNAMGRTEEAIAALERAAAIDPERAAVHLNLGNAYVELDQAEQAADHLLSALAIDPTLKEAHASLGSVFLLAGEVEAAEHHCRLALTLDPDMLVAHQNLASLLAGQGRADEAKAHRDQVYGRQNLIVEPAEQPERTVLVLTTAESGNVPHRDLLPRRRFTRLNWFIEYATPGQAAELPPYDAVFNAVGDMDFAGPTQAPMAAFLELCPKTVINHPAQVAKTGRDNLQALLAGIDHLVTPATVRLPADLIAEQGLARAAAAAGLSVPMLVRPIGSHGGRGLVLADTAEALDAVPVKAGAEVYVTAYHDFQSPDGWWRKYRMIFVDRQPYPYHLAISRDWLVHYESADMPGDPERLAEERRFLDDPEAVLGPQAMAAIRAIGARMDLDYCGIDFTLLPDGRVLVFEANATMLVHRELERGPLAHKNPAVETICAAFQALLSR